MRQPSPYAMGVVLMLLLLSLLPASFSNAADSAVSQPPLSSESGGLPSRYGRVIYHHAAPGAKHLYIIGIGHRDTLTRANGENTVRIQAEVYRIGEWLIKNEEVGILLPEGFFAPVKTAGGALSRFGSRAKRGLATELLDEERLERSLTRSLDANAERLLMESYGIPARQIEDDALYNVVVEKIRDLEESEAVPFAALFGKTELDYLQDRRTAALLENIPEAINNRPNNAVTKNGNAIFTIGADHLSRIILWLKQNSLTISSPAFTSLADYVGELKGLKEFDITVIIPSTIAQDQELLTRTKLAGYLEPSKVASVSQDAVGEK